MASISDDAPVVHDDGPDREYDPRELGEDAEFSAWIEATALRLWTTAESEAA